jgi:hypothetical protein
LGSPAGDYEYTASGVLRYVVWWKLTDFSAESINSTFKTEEKVIQTDKQQSRSNLCFPLAWLMLQS